MSKDARNWGFAVVTLSFVDLPLDVILRFSLAHWFTDKVRCPSDEALSLFLVVLPLLLHRLFSGCNERGLLSSSGAWGPHCSGSSCRGGGL